MDIVMPSGQNLLLFIGAALVLLLIPGPAVLYVVARSITQGRKAGLVSICGIHTATLNPKTALFFLAFLPQFVDVSKGHVAAQIILLGSILAVLGFITDSAYALLAGAVGGWLKRSRSYMKFERYGSGLLFIGLGVTAALSGAKK